MDIKAFKDTYRFFEQISKILSNWEKLKWSMRKYDFFSEEIIKEQEWPLLQHIIHKVAVWFRDHQIEDSYRTACRFEMSADELHERVDAVFYRLLQLKQSKPDEQKYMQALKTFALLEYHPLDGEVTKSDFTEQSTKLEVSNGDINQEDINQEKEISQ